MHLGERRPALKPEAKAAAVIHLESPLLNETELAALSQQGLPVKTLSTQVAVEACAGGLGDALKDLCDNAEQLVRNGAQVLVLSDRVQADGQPSELSATTVAMPALLAVGAVHHHLLRQKLWGECCLPMAHLGNDPSLVGASQNSKANGAGQTSGPRCSQSSRERARLA